MEKLSTNPIHWIFAPIQSVIFKVVGFFWASMWGLMAVNDIYYFEVDDFLFTVMMGHFMVMVMWPICLIFPFTFFVPFIGGYIIWALVFDVHPPLLLFMILSITSSWATFAGMMDFEWDGGWHSIPMLGIPLFLVGWVCVAKVQEIIRNRNVQ
jgi:hypothetical protein